VHYPAAGQTNNGYIAAALGIIFDVDDYSPGVTDAQVKTIDDFFES
jgi:hypothetical protein